MTTTDAARAWHRFGAIAVLFTIAVLSACVVVPPGSGGPGTTSSGYRVTIRRTPHGIPHVTARDWGSLGYGYGYAFAEDNLCELALDVLRVNGEQSRWFGSDEGRLEEDVFFRSVRDAGTVERQVARPAGEGGVSPSVHRLVAGYAAEIDLWRSYYRSELFSGSVALLSGIIAAQPPASTVALRRT